EEPHVRCAVSERATVIAGAENDDLSEAFVKRSDDAVVEEPGPRPQPAEESRVGACTKLGWIDGQISDEARDQPIVGVGVAGRPRGTIERRTGDRNTESRLRGDTGAHSTITSHTDGHARVASTSRCRADRSLRPSIQAVPCRSAPRRYKGSAWKRYT